MTFRSATGCSTSCISFSFLQLPIDLGPQHLERGGQGLKQSVRLDGQRRPARRAFRFACTEARTNSDSLPVARENAKASKASSNLSSRVSFSRETKRIGQ